MATTHHAGCFAMKHIYSEACDLHSAFQSILADKEQQRNALLCTAIHSAEKGKWYIVHNATLLDTTAHTHSHSH